MKDKVCPEITIITATYNAAEYLPSLVLSIREQVYERVQWIVLDGGSVDGTIDIIRQNEDVVDAWLSEPDEGIYDAWNKALRLVRGNWVLFMGADDTFADTQVLSSVAESLKSMENDVLWAYGQIRFVGGNGRSQIVGAPWAEASLIFGEGMAVPHQATFHRRELFERLGGFDPDYRIAGDYEFLLRAVKSGHSPAFFPLCVTHMGGSGISSQPHSALVNMLENARARRNVGVRPVYPLPWCWCLLKALVKNGLSMCMSQIRLRAVINGYRRLTRRPAL